jgi:secreted trypsin-like serine protease
MLIALVGLLASLWSITTPAQALDARIVNGVPGKSGQFPFMVALLDAQKFPQSGGFQSQFCAGSLTSATTVVTAAHCLTNQETGKQIKASEVIVAFTQDLDALDFPTRNVSKVSVNPDYVIKSTVNDIAVLTLSQPIIGFPYIPVLTPELAAEYTVAGNPAQVAGWGNTVSSGNRYPANFRVGDLVVFPDSSCGGSGKYEVNGVRFLGFNASEVDPKVMLCAGGANSAGQVIDACQGDSGGPLVANGSAGPMMIGLVSWGEDCAGKFPGVYTRISAEYNFLVQNNAVPLIAPTIAPAVVVIPISGELIVEVTGGTDGVAITGYAVSVTGFTNDSPTTPVTQNCFAAPSKNSVKGSCTVSNLINGESYTVTAISANSVGNSPVSEPIVGVPSPLPVPGSIVKVQRKQSVARFTISPSIPNGSTVISERVMCTPVGKGVRRSGKVVNELAVVRGLSRTSYRCQVVISTEIGAASSSLRFVKR